jgi:toxin-antitoxin system PIN domain toxin
MIVPDINLLLYATISSFPEHDAARRWLEAIMNGDDPIGLTPPVVFGFLRIASNPRVFDPPMSVDAAAKHVESWLAREHVRYLAPGPRHLELAFELLRRLGAAHDLTTDVQITAYAMENDAVVCSNDSDFARFHGVRSMNPLAG